MDQACIWVRDPVQGEGWIARHAVDGLFGLSITHDEAIRFHDEGIEIVTALLKRIDIPYHVRYDTVTIPGVGTVEGMPGRSHRMGHEPWRKYDAAIH